MDNEMTAAGRADRPGKVPSISSIPPESSAPADRRFKPWQIVAGLAIVGVVVWSAAKVAIGLFGVGDSGDQRGALLYEVIRRPLQVTVTAEGNVESGSNVEVKCRVAGGSTILWIVEDGKVVEEGEVIVRLDTSGISEQLNSQRIVYEKALATAIQAQQDVEAATIAVKEYEEGTFVELLKQAEANIQIALENLRSAENQLKYSKRMVRKGFVSSLQREADEFAVERAKLDLDVATTRKKVLVDFTREKTLKELVAAREAAMARQRSEQASLELEKARLERLQEQLKNCEIIAPKRGMVVYANETGRRRGGSEAQIEEGAMVRESQALVRLPDLTNMQVKVAIHESRVDQVRPGMPARVVVQDQEYTGKVVSIANQPERGSWFSANVKEYATTVSIDGGTSGLKPGMTAKVTVLVAAVGDALAVPVSAVVEQRGRFFCWVKTRGGPERRPLKLGLTNDTVISVLDGVTEGELVYRNPRAVIEDARQEMQLDEQSRLQQFATGPDSGVAPASGDPDAGGPSPAAGSNAGEEAPDAGETRRERRGDGSRGSGRSRPSLMSYDKDGDGSLSREELPEPMQRLLDTADTDGNGSLDASEIAAMRQRFSGGRSRRGGGERGGRDRGDGPGRGDGGGR